MDGNGDIIFIDGLTTYQFIDSHKISTSNRHLGHKDVIKACHPWHLDPANSRFTLLTGMTY